MATSVEAIFLCTFVLVSQNRVAAVADKRHQRTRPPGSKAEPSTMIGVVLCNRAAGTAGAFWTA